MRIQDFGGVYQAATADEVNDAMLRRFGSGCNAIWLSHGDDKFPAIFALINGDLASLHYFSKEGHPGFTSIGNVAGLDGNGFTTFYLNKRGEPQLIINSAVVPFSTALAAAKEFFAFKGLPRALPWFEL